jgi:hypothetical protein
LDDSSLKVGLTRGVLAIRTLHPLTVIFGVAAFLAIASQIAWSLPFLETALARNRDLVAQAAPPDNSQLWMALAQLAAGLARGLIYVAVAGVFEMLVRIYREMRTR